LLLLDPNLRKAIKRTGEGDLGLCLSYLGRECRRKELRFEETRLTRAFNMLPLGTVWMGRVRLSMCLVSMEAQIPKHLHWLLRIPLYEKLVSQ